MALGQKVRSLRKRNLMSQNELAKLMGVGRLTVIRVEHGRSSPHMSTVRKLARALSTTTSDLVPDADALWPDKQL